jgi:type I restriction enzyme S subunit
MSEWKEYKLRDLCNITRGASPRPIHKWISNIGTPWVKISDATVSASRYISHTKEFIQESGEKYSVVVFPGDLILSNSATPGLPRFMNIRACIHDGWLLFRDIKGIDKIFLFYLLLNDRDKYIQFGNGSIFTNLKTDILKEHKIFLPPRPEQQAIAAVLSSLDDKIDLLYRQNKTLEAMAETIWRKIFIEDADSGWEKGKLGDIAAVSTGKGLKRSEYNEYGLYPVIGANGEIGKTDKFLTDEKLILTGRVGTLGEIFVSNEKVWISDNVLIIKPNENRYFYTLYFLLKNIDFENLNVGSTQPLITQSDIKKIEIVFPTYNYLDYFTKLCELVFNKVENNFNQIRTLSRLRDTLLPKLMSGKVRVKV